VSAAHCLPVEVRLYDRLFTVQDPESGGEGRTFLDFLHRDSLETLRGCCAEPGLARQACTIASSSSGSATFAWIRTLVRRSGLNRIVSLRDTWARIEQRGARGQESA